jgi:hypothetical protein
MELPIHPATELLFSAQSMVRWVAVRALGQANECPELLEYVAERDEEPIVGLSAAFWLAMNGHEIWLRHLAELAVSLTDKSLAQMADGLYEMALTSYDEVICD